MTMANDTNFRKDIVASVKAAYGKQLPILQAEIPATVRLAEISTANHSIFEHEPRGRAAEAYRLLVKEVMEIGEKQRSKSSDIHAVEICSIVIYTIFYKTTCNFLSSC